jgi:hypothetical protein
MKLATERSYALLAEQGLYVTEVCEGCARVVAIFPPLTGERGAICNRFTRQGEPGVWCSRVCRDGINAHEPRTCRHCKARLPEEKRRGVTFCDDACRKAYRRQDGVQDPELSRTKPSIYAPFRSVSRPASYPPSQTPLNAAIADKKTAPGGFSQS